MSPSVKATTCNDHTRESAHIDVRPSAAAKKHSNASSSCLTRTTSVSEASHGREKPLNNIAEYFKHHIPEFPDLNSIGARFEDNGDTPEIPEHHLPFCQGGSYCTCAIGL